MSAPPDAPPGDGVLLLLGWIAGKIDAGSSIMGYRCEANDLKAASIIVGDAVFDATYRITVRQVGEESC